VRPRPDILCAPRKVLWEATGGLPSPSDRGRRPWAADGHGERAERDRECNPELLEIQKRANPALPVYCSCKWNLMRDFGEAVRQRRVTHVGALVPLLRHQNKRSSAEGPFGRGVLFDVPLWGGRSHMGHFFTTPGEEGNQTPAAKKGCWLVNRLLGGIPRSPSSLMTPTKS